MEVENESSADWLHRQSNFQLSVESNPGLNWFCFTVLFDWSRKLAPPSQPIRCKLKPIAPWSLAFSRATGRLHAFTSSCHWLPLIISFTLIGHCDYFGFGFRHSIEKRSNHGVTISAIDFSCVEAYIDHVLFR